MADFLEFSVIPAEPAEENAEIITAFISEYPFDVFEFTDGKVKAYTSQLSLQENMDEIAETIAPYISGEISSRLIPKENWNELWEKNFFEPVTIDNRIHIRAAFHPVVADVQHEIVIQPKMSFGTGHHATTQLMVSLMLEHESEFPNAKVLDMGSGTGVLAIVGELLGASHVDAVDIEDWSAENIAENAEINQCKKIAAFCDDVHFFENKEHQEYKIILANIHRQVLLNDTTAYANAMLAGGLLFLSGFYPEDLKDVSENCEKNGLEFIAKKELGQWCAAVYKKK